MVVHEIVANPVDEMEIHPEKIAIPLVERGDRGIVDGVKLRQSDHQLLGAAIHLRIDLRKARNEEPKNVMRDVLGPEAKLGKLAGHRGGMHASRRHRPRRAF